MVPGYPPWHVHLERLSLTSAPRILADPGSWQIAAPVAGDFANIFLYARAKIANAVGKPWILEETGMEVRGCLVLW